MLSLVRSHALRACALAVSLALASPAAAVSIDWVTVGDPGNAADTATGFGAVATTYQISETEITNAQYTEFLNAVADSDPNALYSGSMANGGSGHGGINRSGSDGSYAYTAVSGREAMPVNYVSFYDALRFVNWLSNGQPTGAQGSSTTEDGSYTITSQGVTDNSILRNPGATLVLTSEDEWYKAAYYDSSTLSYLDYPADSDTQTGCDVPTATANRANCGNAIGAGSGGLTEVGSYTGSASPYGTFDQGGNVYEWNEAILFDDFRGIRGGAFHHGADKLAAAFQGLDSPHSEGAHIGFRIAMIPEPGTGLLLAAGLAGLALRRRQA